MSTLDSRDQSAGGYKLHREITPQISISSLLITVSELLLKAQSNNKSSVLFSPRKAEVILLAMCLLLFFV